MAAPSHARVTRFRVMPYGPEVTVTTREESLTASVNRIPVYSFDGSGRLLSVFVGDRTYRRGLDNRMVEIQSDVEDGVPVRRRRTVEPVERRAILERMYDQMRAIGDALARAAVAFADEAEPEGPRATLAAWWARLLARNPDNLDADEARFRAIYRPISVLPPDQYLALVLQVTEGCPYNACTFCDFYRDRPFRIKGEAEVRAHITAVKAFLGGGLAMRRTIFLADANALVIPQAALLRLCDLLEVEFPPVERGGTRRGVYAFMDLFSGEFRSEAAFHVLAERGLRRVYLGLETGCDRLLKFLGKPTSAADAIQTVATLKAAGVGVGIIVMVGVGGRAYADAHVNETAEAVNAMGLDGGDIVYFSDFVEHPGLEYARRARQDGIAPLSRRERWEQRRRIEAGLRFPDPARKPKLAWYDIREFVY